MNDAIDINVVNQTENTQQNITEPETIQNDTPEQINWKKFREERSRERKEKEESDRALAKKAQEAEALKAALEAITRNPSETNDLSEETEEQRIRRQVKEALDEREKQYEKERNIREQQELPARLVAAFSDFDQVCTHENIDYLKFHYPEVMAPYKNLPDSFDTWASMYKSIKRFVPNPDSKKDQRKAEKNFNRPQSMNVPGVTQGGDSSPVKKLDDQRKQENWKRMQKNMR